MNNSDIFLMQLQQNNLNETGLTTNNQSFFNYGSNNISTDNMLNNLSNENNQCAFEQPPLTDVRFWIVTVFGTTVSFVSIIENSFFFYLFSTRKHHRTTYNMYMMFLTFFDIFVSGAYVLLMSMNVLSDYLQSPVLVQIWFHYMVPILTVSHCGLTSSTFLILAATFERYCLSDKLNWVQFVQRHRKYVLLSAILLGILSKGTICIEFEILHIKECVGTMMEFQLQFQDFVYGTPYHTVWRFWYRNVVTVFFPFFALLILNIQIVRTLAQVERQSLSLSNTNLKQFKRKKVARSATRATVLVVFTYLFSNIINVVLTTWEHIDKTLLVTDYVQAYAIALDLASLLTNLASAFRPPIYLICQPTLRKEVFLFFKQTFCTSKAKRSTTHNTQTVTDIHYSQFDDNSDLKYFNGVLPCTIKNVSVSPVSTTKVDHNSISDMELLRDESDFMDQYKNDDEYGVLLPNYGGKLVAIAARMHRYQQVYNANNKLGALIMPSCVNASPCLTPIDETKKIQKINNIKDIKNKLETSSLKFEKYIPKKTKKNFSLYDGSPTNNRNFYFTKNLNNEFDYLIQNNLLKNQLNNNNNKLLNNSNQANNKYIINNNNNNNNEKNYKINELINYTSTNDLNNFENCLNRLKIIESNSTKKLLASEPINSTTNNLQLFDDDSNSVNGAQINSLKNYLFQLNNKETLL